MKLFTIKNMGVFMTKLLSEKETTFDQFLLSEATIVTRNTYTIDGHLNKEFYSNEELEIMRTSAVENGRIFSEDFIRWESVKALCFSCIKGKNTPLSFKFCFQLSPENIAKFISGLDTAINTNDIASLNLNIKYDGHTLACTTAVNLKIFTMDKTVEHSWDDMVYRFLIANSFDIES